MQERDFVGYGPNPSAIAWPGGARIAVSVVVNYEEGSEYSTLDGDPSGETSGESPSPLGPGERDLANESFFEYGSRVGVWRIMDILDRNNVKGTFYACALALERNPQVGPEAIRRGHEVMGHGNRWEEYYRMDRDAEREAIRQAVESITRICGQRPLGWYTRYGPSVNTRDLVVEEGGFEYDCNSYNDDLPYYTQVGGIAGDLDTVVGFLSEVMAMFEAMQHLISNIDITIDGDEATVTAMVYNPLKLPDSPVWATGGWYHHKLVRTAEGWRSCSLVEEAGWFDGVPEPARPADEDSSG